MVSQNYTPSLKTNIFNNLFYLSLFSPILLGRHGENSKWMIRHAIIIMFSPTLSRYTCFIQMFVKKKKKSLKQNQILGIFYVVIQHY